MGMGNGMGMGMGNGMGMGMGCMNNMMGMMGNMMMMMNQMSQMNQMNQMQGGCGGCCGCDGMSGKGKSKGDRPRHQIRSDPYLGCVQGVPEANPDDVRAFLSEHGCDDSVCSKMMAIDPKLQSLVMTPSHGPLHGASNVNALLVSRIVRMTNLSPGDWVCL